MRLPIVDAPLVYLDTARAELEGNNYLEACFERILWGEWTHEVCMVYITSWKFQFACRIISPWI